MIVAYRTLRGDLNIEHDRGITILSYLYTISHDISQYPHVPLEWFEDGEQFLFLWAISKLHGKVVL